MKLLDALARRLTRGRIAALAVALVTVAGAVVLVGVFARGWWRDEGGSYAPRTILARADVTPPSSLFGDVLLARAEVLVDARRVDPASVELAPAFRPYRIRSQSRRVERGPGRAALVRFDYSIQCLTRACVRLSTPRAKGDADVSPVELPPAPFTARLRDGGSVKASLTWPAFVVHSRLSEEEAALSTPRIEPKFAPPKVSWTITPNLLGGLALGAAVVLVLGAGGLVATALLRDGRRLRVPRIPAHLTAVERALALAEHAAAHGEVDEERKALERLAIELRRSGAGELAVQAGRLAWSEDDPSPNAVGALATAVRSNGAH